jgi:hypothetical protein
MRTRQVYTLMTSVDYQECTRYIMPMRPFHADTLLVSSVPGNRFDLYVGTLVLFWAAMPVETFSQEEWSRINAMATEQEWTEETRVSRLGRWHINCPEVGPGTQFTFRLYGHGRFNASLLGWENE